MSKTRNMNVSLVIWLFLVEGGLLCDHFDSYLTPHAHTRCIVSLELPVFPFDSIRFDSCVSSSKFSPFSFVLFLQFILRLQIPGPFNPMCGEIPASNIQYTHFCVHVDCVPLYRLCLRTMTFTYRNQNKH